MQMSRIAIRSFLRETTPIMTHPLIRGHAHLDHVIDTFLELVSSHGR